ncbi:MAG TPA: hypothetical protein PKC74_02695, partial [Turneriella sp.]|nr:hypothetical protein [Turneriella sp.]
GHLVVGHARVDGDALAAVLMRKHLTQYTRDLPVYSFLKPEMYRKTSAVELKDFLLRAAEHSALVA